MSGDTKPAPLSGIRVLDFGHIVAGPFCVKVLADLGADVVKVESSTRAGETGASRKTAATKSLHGRTPTLAHVNRNRRSIDLNLKTDYGREIALRLAAAADVIVENFSSGVMDRLGLGYETLKRANPGLIFTSMSGYGHEGPRRDWTGMNVNLQAYTGLMMATGSPGDPPIGISNSWNDYIAGLHAALAVIGALGKRQAGDTGRHLDVSQFECGVSMLGGLLMASAINGKNPPRLGNRSAHAAPQGCYRCAGDDSWCTISVQSDEQWQALAKLLAKNDAAYATLAGRIAHHDALDAAIEAWTSGLTAAEVETRCRAIGVAADRVRGGGDMRETAEWQHCVRSIEDPPGQTTDVVGLPFYFSGNAMPAATRAPAVGEHNDDVLRDWLGLTAAEIADLQPKKVSA